MTEKSAGRPRTYEIDAKTRKCRECLDELPISNFNPDRLKKNGYLNIETRCILCMRAKKYGSTRQEIAAITESQNNCCALCLSPLVIARTTHIDHCHKTGRVRGILCHHCNLGLGNFKDNPEVLSRAIDYLNG